MELKELNYDNILTEVKKIVKKYIKKSRPIGLAFSYFDVSVGAFWVEGGNYITMNANILDAMDKMQKSRLEKEALVKVLLMHEYIHSLGYEDELVTRNITKDIMGREFGTESLEFKLSDDGPWALYPELTSYPGYVSNKINVVTNFDSENTNYIM